jgi:hypothetical protein
MVSDIPIVNGDGPRDEPMATPAVLNSKLPTLSARDIDAGLIRPRAEVEKKGQLTKFLNDFAGFPLTRHFRTP